MTFNVVALGAAETPTVVSSFVTHVLSRSKRKKDGQPNGQLRYAEGLAIVRRFLEYASHDQIEALQAFTAMRLPVPRWVRRHVVQVVDESINKAEAIFVKHTERLYGKEGITELGGQHWWRQRGRVLEAEWIEMRKDYVARAAAKVDLAQAQDGETSAQINERVILYIHGGAGFFSSLDTHRYQIQRHARKIGGRAFAPAYRLAPQYPFPCGLIDSLAAYLYLIDPPASAPHEPILTANLVLSGDSHGANMVLSLLCILRDEGLPMPAGASLISPWVDLTHSFPSIVGDASGDYIPPVGFHYAPSLAWPPAPGDGIDVEIDGKSVRLDEQIQMYCSNRLLGHPLVSPINQGSIGGLCPLLIVGGSGELLRDEITYLGHKAASPSSYPPSPATLAAYPAQKDQLGRYPPTKVQLQIYDGCAHVTTTLSFTAPAKHMFRSCANFHIWAVTAAAKAHERAARHQERHAQRHSRSQPPSRASTLSLPIATDTSGQPIIDDKAAQMANAEELDDGDLESEASTDSEDEVDRSAPPGEMVTVNGTLPAFTDSLIRERISTRGRIRPLEPVAEIASLNLPPDHVGAVRSDGPIKTWLARRAEWDRKYAKKLAYYRQLRQADRVNALAARFPQAGGDGDEVPPLTALAGWYDPKFAYEAGRAVDGVQKEQTSGLVAMWVKAGGEADRVRDEKHERETKELEAQMEEVGVDKEHQAAAADAPVEEVKEHIEGETAPLQERTEVTQQAHPSQSPQPNMGL